MPEHHVNDTVCLENDALVYYSPDDLGWAVVGLDVGNVTGPSGSPNEIVAGLWADDGSRLDSKANDTTKSRGHIVIFSTPEYPAAGANAISEEWVTLDDNYSPGRSSTGILGAKIDDVKSHGKSEIWCGDAHGYLYCLARCPSEGNKFVAFYRSASIGAYPGVANNIFPVKDTSGRTTHMVVFTSGYVYRFTVNRQVIPW